MKAVYAADSVLEIYCTWEEFRVLVTGRDPSWSKGLSGRAAALDPEAAMAIREHMRRGGTPRIVPNASQVSA